MRGGAVARRYAGALIELAAAQGAVDPVRKALAALADAWRGSPELRAVMRSPTVDLEGRTKVMEALGRRLGVPPLLQHAVALLVRRGRIALLPDLAEAYERLAFEREGRVRAEVVTAARVGRGYLEELRAVLEQVTGRKVALEHRVDESLLGGVVARVGDVVFDGSVRNRLEELRERLLA